MNYYLHRISHEMAWSYPLLEDKDLLSIGWSYFGAKRNFVPEHQDDWSKVPETVEREPGYGRNRARFGLQRFLEMEPGDRVVIPTSRAFHVYEIVDRERLVPAQIDVEGLRSWQQQGASVDDDGYLRTESGVRIDLGFFRRVKVIARNIPRRGYADSALTSRMKVRQANVRLNRLKASVDAAVEAHRRKQPIDLHSLILDECAGSVLKTIVKKSNPDQFERLIHSWFEHQGATARILPKKKRDKEGDADVEATFESLNLKVYVQAKHHTGKSDERGITQIDNYVKNKEKGVEYVADQQIVLLAWVISTGEFSDECRKRANEDHVRLIDGKEFAGMLLDVGIGHLEDLQ